MRVTNWGMLLLGVYLVLAGLSSLGILGFLAGFYQLIYIIALVAGILIIMEHSRGQH
jgi:hypothetical protein